MPLDPPASRGPTTRDGPTGEALRVLIVDESPRDRDLIREALQRGFPSVETIEIGDSTELERVIQTGAFDVVLADHRPSWIDAFKVLIRVRERFSYLPVILCTGTGSEELAVAAMKAGFDDYVLKHPHHFPRLNAAIRSALEEATRRRIAYEAESRYRSLFEGVPVGLYRATLSGQILDANPALIRLLGFSSRESLMAVNLRDIHTDPKSRRAFLERLEREGEVHDLELQWKRYGGQIITVRKSARPVRDSSGRLLHYEGVVEDITERKRAREEVQESNQFRHEIISGAGEGIIVYDRDLRYIVWNRFMENLTGVSAHKVLGRRAPDLFPHPRHEGVDKLLERALSGETVSSDDVHYAIPQTNRSGWVVGTYGPHRNAAGEIMGVIGIVRDVTERRRSEELLRRERAFLRQVIDINPHFIFAKDREGRFTLVNEAVAEAYGTTVEELIGKTDADFNPNTDEVEFFRRADLEVMDTFGEKVIPEEKITDAAGKVRWLQTVKRPVVGDGGGVTQVLGVATDITHRRRAEEELKESEARYRTQIEHAPEAIVVLDADTGRFIEANDNAVELYRVPREALFRMGPAELSPSEQPDGRPSAEAAMEKIMQALDGGVPVFEWMHRNAEGREIPCEVRLVRLPSAKRRLIRGSVTDISERKRSEKLQSALYRIAATASSAEDIDEFYAAIHGIVGELMDAKNFYVALHDEVHDVLSFPYFVDEADERPQPKKLGKGLTEYVLRTGQPLLASDEDFNKMVGRGEVELVGSWSVDWLGVPLKRGGTTFGVLVVQSYDPRSRHGPAEKEVLTFVSQQIAVALERKRAQEAVRESEERYRLLFERNLAGVYRTTLTGRILECNEALARMFGYASREELLHRDIRDLYPVERKDFLESLLQFRHLTNYEMCGQQKDGRAVWVLENASLLADEQAGEIIVEGTVTDITERKLLEEQLRHSQKMEAIGQLAGGIAHDFNNLLTSVLGYGDIALRQLSPHDPIRADIQEIQKAGERAAKLTRQLLAFSRKQVFEPRVVDLNALIAESTRMLERLIGENIRLATELDPSLGNVHADPGQLEQVIVNLVVNARDAMPEGGTLTIRTRNADVEGSSAQTHFGAGPGRYVVIAVGDTGIGIDADAQKRIFEPFFTTKEMGKGTGLGLATVYGIVSQSGGQVFVASEPGEGTTFAVYLPRVDASEQSEKAPPVLEAARRGSETILLVEDEDAVRDLTRRCLESSGYTVLQASSAEEAVEVVTRHSGKLDLLLTDVIMSGASGPELSRRLLARRPELRVLFVSGYPDEAMASEGILEPGAFFLPKPFTPDTLARKVRDVLDSPVTGTIEG